MYSGKYKKSLHQFIVEKWYGKELLDEMYKKGFIIEHLDNNEFNNTLSNLDFLLSDYNTAKGQWLDKDIVKYRDRIALRMYKNFHTDTYEISVAFNECFDEKLADGRILPVKAIHFLYDTDYITVLLDASKIIHDYIFLSTIQMDKLSFCDIRIEYAHFVDLTDEERERVGNGNGGIIERDGKILLIPGKYMKIVSGHKIKEWDEK